jgi:dTMP kinase
MEIIGLIWGPAKDATVPNLVPRERLEAANQVSLLATYGSAPIAAILFSLLALINSALAVAMPFFKSNPTNLALYIDGATGFYSAITIYRLKAITTKKVEVRGKRTGLITSLVDGWKYIGQTRKIRGMVIGMIGAFISGGAVIGLGRTFVSDLGGGNAAYGILFCAIFTGMAFGMWFEPKMFPKFSRDRLFGFALTSGGGSLLLLALISNLVMALLLTIILGTCAGVTWIIGFTMLGSEVDDEVRGRTFAFVESLIRVALISVLALAPILAATIGRHEFHFNGNVLNYNGAEMTLTLGGIFAILVGIISSRQMVDRSP